MAYNRAALQKDWRLVWTTVPLVEAAALPPASTWGLLGLRSPPPFERVAAHLEAIGADGGDACLANWPQEVRGPTPSPGWVGTTKHANEGEIVYIREGLRMHADTQGMPTHIAFF